MHHAMQMKLFKSLYSIILVEGDLNDLTCSFIVWEVTGYDLQARRASFNPYIIFVALK